MSLQWKKITTSFLVLCLLVHFFLIVLKTMPYKLANTKLNAVAGIYSYPYFHQNWNLFVPAPSVKRNLMVRYQTPDNKWSSWHEIGCAQISHYKNNTATGGDMMWLLWSNTLHYSSGLLPKQSHRFDQFPENSKPTKQLINRYMKEQFGLLNGTACEWLIVNQADQKSYATYFKNLVIN